MDLLWIIVGVCFLLAGLAGSVLPLLPGPPLSYVGLLVLQLRTDPPFSVMFLVVWAIVVVLITVLDYLVPMYGTRRFGGSKYGLWGCTLGLLAGFWFGPLGIIIGPFAGAFIGEWLANSNSQRAMQAAFGSFVGFVFGTLLKLVTCLVMCWYFFTAL